MSSNSRPAADNNVDPAEIAKFEQLADRWWDYSGEFKPLHDINPLRLNFIDERAAISGKRVLDVGCGGGILAESMAARGAEVTAIDMGEAPLSVARLHMQKSGLQVDYRQSTAEAMAEDCEDQFDTVTCLEMLEHVPDPASVIDACARLCKPGGHLFFSTINRNAKSFMFAVVGAEYVLRMLPRGTHEYQRFIKPSEMSGWLRQCGLQLGDMTGLTYNPLSDQYRLNSRDVSVNYMLHARKPL